MSREFVEDALYPVVYRELGDYQSISRNVVMYKNGRFVFLNAQSNKWDEKDFLWIGGRLVIGWPVVRMGFEDE